MLRELQNIELSMHLHWPGLRYTMRTPDAGPVGGSCIVHRDRSAASPLEHGASTAATPFRDRYAHQFQP